MRGHKKRGAKAPLLCVPVFLVLIRVRIGHDRGAAGRADKVFAVFEHFLVEIGVFTAAGAFEFHEIVVVILFDVKKLGSKGTMIINLNITDSKFKTYGEEQANVNIASVFALSINRSLEKGLVALP